MPIPFPEQDIFSAGLTLLCLMVGRNSIFQAKTRQSLIFEMSALLGTAPLEAMANTFCKNCFA